MTATRKPNRQHPCLLSELEQYIAKLKVVQGRHAGEPFTLLAWERRFLRGAFADGVKTSALSIARGNGKSSFLATIACAALDGPLAMPKGETLIAAASFMQARDHLRLRHRLHGRQARGPEAVAHLGHPARWRG